MTKERLRAPKPTKLATKPAEAVKPLSKENTQTSPPTCRVKLSTENQKSQNDTICLVKGVPNFALNYRGPRTMSA